MPDSLVSQLVNSAWDKISEAVADGLASGKQPTLADVVSVVTRQLDATTWDLPVDRQADDCWRRFRRSTTMTAFDYQYRFLLSYDALRSPDTDRIRTWAERARRFEFRHILGELVDVARRNHFPVGTTPSRATVGGWGELRCLAFSNAPGNLTALEWDGPIRLNFRSPGAPIQALLFRLGGGPYLQRPADLALGWLPAGDDGAHLVLTEQIQIVNATENTITGINMVGQ
jgi:hypothetical protein